MNWVDRLRTRTTHDADAHSALKCCARGLVCIRTQCTVNLEHSNTLSTQCTRNNGHSALSATHLIGTEYSVRASCVVPCARDPRRPPWTSLSLSLPLASPRSSRLRLSLRRPKAYRNLRARTGMGRDTGIFFNLRVFIKE